MYIYIPSICWPLTVVSWNIKHWRNCFIKTLVPKHSLLVKSHLLRSDSHTTLPSIKFSLQKTLKNHWSGCLSPKAFWRSIFCPQIHLILMKPLPTKIFCEKMLSDLCMTILTTHCWDDFHPRKWTSSMQPPSSNVLWLVVCCKSKNQKRPEPQRELGLRSSKAFREAVSPRFKQSKRFQTNVELSDSVWR